MTENNKIIHIIYDILNDCESYTTSHMLYKYSVLYSYNKNEVRAKKLLKINKQKSKSKSNAKKGEFMFEFDFSSNTLYINSKLLESISGKFNIGVYDLIILIKKNINLYDNEIIVSMCNMYSEYHYIITGNYDFTSDINVYGINSISCTI